MNETACKPVTKATRTGLKWKKWIAAPAIIAFVFVSQTGCTVEDPGGSESEPSENSASAEDTAPKPKPKPKPKLKIVKVTAAQILKDYEENELASDDKYKGNLIQVRGVVRKIDKELFGSDYVLQIGTVNEYDFLTVDCNGMSKKVLSTLKTGERVKVIGKFDDGGDLGVQLEKCKLA